MAVEEPAFQVISSTASYDLRVYPSVLVAETTIDASFDDAGSQAFRLLAGYIFGANRSRSKLAMTAPVSQQAQPEKIAMTAPVSQRAASKGFLVQFTMPAGYTLATLPIPDDPRVTLREIPPRKVAVLRYSGSWSKARYEKKLKVLRDAMDKDGLRAQGEPEFARFNSPFQLWFLRRNEIWIAVAP
jgi:hypothetical protein